MPEQKMSFLQIDKRFADSLNGGKYNDQPKQGAEYGFIYSRQTQISDEYRYKNMDKNTAQCVFTLPFGVQKKFNGIKY
jgi:hypothetical protein